MELRPSAELNDAVSRGALPGSLLALDGPIREASSIPWATGATLAAKFLVPVTITGDVQVCGPLYMRDGAIVAKDGTHELAYSTPAAGGDSITAVIETSDNGAMRLGRVS